MKDDKRFTQQKYMLVISQKSSLQNKINNNNMEYIKNINYKMKL